MLLKGTIAAAALLGTSIVTIGLSATTSPTETVIKHEPTLARSPISLGNATTAPAMASLSDFGRSLAGAVGIEIEPHVTLYERPYVIRKGDTLARILHRAKIDGQEAESAIRAMGDVHDPTRIKAGGKVLVRFRHAVPSTDTVGKDTFYGLALPLDPRKHVEVSRLETGGYIAAIKTLELETRAVRAEGEIKSSLYVAARDAGVSASVISELIRIFSWDVDFQRDIRKGDRFEVMYSRHSDETGKAVYSDGIVFAALTLSGERKAMYAMAQADGRIEYFDETGQSAKKALMRTPIDGARLSSSFGKRKHPILGYTKVHKGADFAAPSGTPIYAAGDGRVDRAGWNGAYGKYIRIRHNGEYSTAYAHLKSIKATRGKRVRQGEVIGYVGSTGRSTGPHLHYEILRNNKQVNPMKVKMPSGRKLKGNELAAFTAQRDALRQRWTALASEAGQLAER